MLKLVPYDVSFEAVTLNRISEFFGFHYALVQKTDLENERLAASDDNFTTLAEWQIHPNSLFVIVCDDVSVGFIRINYRGPNVAWIEDIFIDTPFRGRGIASSAIAAVETIIMNTPGYTAVCLDVSPRNKTALRLYHKLGYVDLSLITLRKEFESSKRDRPIRLLDLDFKF
jgi:RimJ/RimL family protein N-acetyltransferase